MSGVQNLAFEPSEQVGRVSIEWLHEILLEESCKSCNN